MAPLVGLAFAEDALAYLETIPHKIRAQVIKKAKALQLNPHPQGTKPLKGYESKNGERVFRERSGDYRILYVVRTNPDSVTILDIDNRKDVYKK